MNKRIKTIGHNTQITHPPQTYQIKVQGHLDSTWSEWFDDMTVTHDTNHQTLITGQVPDQSALLGLLLKVHHLGLQLVSVHQIEPNK